MKFVSVIHSELLNWIQWRKKGATKELMTFLIIPRFMFSEIHLTEMLCSVHSFFIYFSKSINFLYSLILGFLFFLISLEIIIWLFDYFSMSKFNYANDKCTLNLVPFYLRSFLKKNVRESQIMDHFLMFTSL